MLGCYMLNMTIQHARRPIIGIPCRVVAEAWYPPVAGNTVSYLRAVEAAGGIPLLMHCTRDAEVLDTHYWRCDALLLAGGQDVDPQFYGAPPHPKLEQTDPLQDAIEIALIHRALADGMPIFGICRGIQILNVAMGGTLYQDIPSELPHALDHGASNEQRGMDYRAHAVTLDAASWLAQQLDATDLLVNTVHHQALARVADGLRVVGRAPDGVVEAVEGTGSSFVVGVQCHPEMLWEHADPRWARVFERFVQVARRATPAL